MARVGVRAILFKRVTATMLEVFWREIATTYLELGTWARPNQPRVLDLLAQEVVWDDTMYAKSDVVDLVIEAGVGPKGPFPSETIRLNHRHEGGARESALNVLRLDAEDAEQTRFVRAWEDWEQDYDHADRAYMFLVADDHGKLHARYLPDLEGVPDILRGQIEGKRRGEVEFEQGVALPDKLTQDVYNALLRDKNVILYGPPGTGKTWLMKEIERVFIHGASKLELDLESADKPFVVGETATLEGVPAGKAHRRTEFVTFHQSTSYESFVCGLRPVTDKKTGATSYPIVTGPLLDAAEHAAGKKKASLLLVDEINRGNTSEILGELITLLEKDKRVTVAALKADDDLRDWNARLPYTHLDTKNGAITDGRLRLPPHLYLLASMNSVDRSVAPLDSALRRRFRIIDVPPRLELLEQNGGKLVAAASENGTEGTKHLVTVTVGLLEKINWFVGWARGPEFQLGQSYVWDVLDPTRTIDLKTRRTMLVEAFYKAILPQVREVLRGEPDGIRALFGDHLPLLAQEVKPDPRWASHVHYGDSWLKFRADVPQGDKAFQMLAEIAGKPQQTESVDQNAAPGGEE